MFTFSRKIDYGLFLTAELAQKQLNGETEPLSLKKLSQQHTLSFFFLQKIAHDLRSADLITSSRGKSGGYALAHKAKDISLKDILEALEGPINVMSCFDTSSSKTSDEHNCIRASSCSARKGLGLVKNKLTETLTDIRLTDFIKPSRKGIHILNI